MAGHMAYEERKRFVFRGLGLLAMITLVEVVISLAGKGHIPGFGWLTEYRATTYIIGAALIAFSLYKAYFIIYDFMHLRNEVSGMAATILLPMFLLVWAIIAFFQEGSFWGERRAIVQESNALPSQEIPAVSPLEQGKTMEIQEVPNSPTATPDGGEEEVGKYDVEE